MNRAPEGPVEVNLQIKIFSFGFPEEAVARAARAAARGLHAQFGEAFWLGIPSATGPPSYYRFDDKADDGNHAGHADDGNHAGHDDVLIAVDGRSNLGKAGA